MRNIKKMLAKSFLVVSLSSIIAVGMTAMDGGNNKKNIKKVSKSTVETSKPREKSGYFEKSLRYAKDNLNLSNEEAEIYAEQFIKCKDKNRSRLYAINFVKATEMYAKDKLVKELADVYATCMTESQIEEKALSYVELFKKKLLEVKNIEAAKEYIQKLIKESPKYNKDIYKKVFNKALIRGYDIRDCDFYAELVTECVNDRLKGLKKYSKRMIPCSFRCDYEREASPYCFNEEYPKLFLKALDTFDHDTDLARSYAYIAIECGNEEIAKKYAKIYQKKREEGYSCRFADEYASMDLLESSSEESMKQFEEIYNKVSTEKDKSNARLDKKNIIYAKCIILGLDEFYARRYSEVSVEAEREIDEKYTLSLYINAIISNNGAQAEKIKRIYKEKVYDLKWNRLKTYNYILKILSGFKEQDALRFAEAFEDQLKMGNNMVKSQILADYSLSKGNMKEAERYADILTEVGKSVYDSDLANLCAGYIFNGEEAKANEYIDMYKERIGKTDWSRARILRYIFLIDAGYNDSYADKYSKEFIKQLNVFRDGERADFFTLHILKGSDIEKIPEYYEIFLKERGQSGSFNLAFAITDLIVNGKEETIDRYVELYRKKLELGWGEIGALKYAELMTSSTKSEKYAKKYSKEFENQMKLNAMDEEKSKIITECIVNDKKDMAYARRFYEAFIKEEGNRTYSHLIADGKEKEVEKIKELLSQGQPEESVNQYIKLISSGISEQEAYEKIFVEQQKKEKIYNEALKRTDNEEYAKKYVDLYLKFEKEIDKDIIDICIDRMTKGKSKEYSINYATLYNIAKSKYKNDYEIEVYVSKVMENKDEQYIERFMRLYKKYYNGDPIKAEIAAEYELENGSDNNLEEYLKIYLDEAIEKRKFNKKQAKMYSKLVIDGNSKSYINKYMNAYCEKKFDDEIGQRLYAQQVAEGKTREYAEKYTCAYSEKLKETSDPTLSGIYAYYLSNSNAARAKKESKIYSEKVKEYGSIEQAKLYMDLTRDGKSSKYADQYSKAYVDAERKYEKQDEIDAYVSWIMAGNDKADLYLEKYKSYKAKLNNIDQAKKYATMVVKGSLTEAGAEVYFAYLEKGYGEDESEICMNLSLNDLGEEYIEKYMDIYKKNKSRFNDKNRLKLYVDQVMAGKEDEFSETYANAYMNNFEKSKDPEKANEYALLVVDYGKTLANKMFPIYEKKAAEFKNKKRAIIFAKAVLKLKKSNDYANKYSKAYVEGMDKLNDEKKAEIYADWIASNKDFSKAEEYVQKYLEFAEKGKEDANLFAEFSLDGIKESDIEEYVKLYKEELKKSNNEKNAKQITDFVIIYKVPRKDINKYLKSLINIRKKYNSNYLLKTYVDILLNCKDEKKANVYIEEFSEKLINGLGEEYSKIYADKVINFSKKYADNYIKVFKKLEENFDRKVAEDCSDMLLEENDEKVIETYAKAYKKKFDETGNKDDSLKYACATIISEDSPEFIDNYYGKFKLGWTEEKIYKYNYAIKIYKDEEKAEIFIDSYYRFLKLFKSEEETVKCANLVAQGKQDATLIEREFKFGMSKWNNIDRALVYIEKFIMDKTNAELYVDNLIKTTKMYPNRSKTPDITEPCIENLSKVYKMYYEKGKLDEDKVSYAISIYLQCVLDDISNVEGFVNEYKKAMKEFNNEIKAEAYTYAVSIGNNRENALKFIDEYEKMLNSCLDKTRAKSYAYWILSGEEPENALKLADLYEEHFKKSRSRAEANVFAYYSLKNPENLSEYIDICKRKVKEKWDNERIFNYIELLKRGWPETKAAGYSKLYANGINELGDRIKAEAYANWITYGNNSKLAAKYAEIYSENLKQTNDAYISSIYAYEMVLSESETKAQKRVDAYKTKLASSFNDIEAYEYTIKLIQKNKEEDAQLYAKAYARSFAIWKNQYKSEIYAKAVLNKIEPTLATKYADMYMKCLLDSKSDKYADMGARLYILGKPEDYIYKYLQLYYEALGKYKDEEKAKFYAQIMLNPKICDKVSIFMKKYDQKLSTLEDKKKTMLYSYYSAINGENPSLLWFIEEILLLDYKKENPIDKDALLFIEFANRYAQKITNGNKNIDANLSFIGNVKTGGSAFETIFKKYQDVELAYRCEGLIEKGNIQDAINEIEDHINTMSRVKLYDVMFDEKRVKVDKEKSENYITNYEAGLKKWHDQKLAEIYAEIKRYCNDQLSIKFVETFAAQRDKIVSNCWTFAYCMAISCSIDEMNAKTYANNYEVGIINWKSMYYAKIYADLISNGLSKEKAYDVVSQNFIAPDEKSLVTKDQVLGQAAKFDLEKDNFKEFMKHKENRDKITEIYIDMLEKTGEKYAKACLFRYVLGMRKWEKEEYLEVYANKIRINENVDDSNSYVEAYKCAREKFGFDKDLSRIYANLILYGSTEKDAFERVVRYKEENNKEKIRNLAYESERLFTYSYAMINWNDEEVASLYSNLVVFKGYNEEVASLYIDEYVAMLSNGRYIAKLYFDKMTSKGLKKAKKFIAAYLYGIEKWKNKELADKYANEIMNGTDNEDEKIEKEIDSISNQYKKESIAKELRKEEACSKSLIKAYASMIRRGSSPGEATRYLNAYSFGSEKWHNEELADIYARKMLLNRGRSYAVRFTEAYRLAKKKFKKIEMARYYAEVFLREGSHERAEKMTLEAEKTKDLGILAYSDEINKARIFGKKRWGNSKEVLNLYAVLRARGIGDLKAIEVVDQYCAIIEKCNDKLFQEQLSDEIVRISGQDRTYIQVYADLYANGLKINNNDREKAIDYVIKSIKDRKFDDKLKEEYKLEELYEDDAFEIDIDIKKV